MAEKYEATEKRSGNAVSAAKMVFVIWTPTAGRTTAMPTSALSGTLRTRVATDGSRGLTIK